MRWWRSGSGLIFGVMRVLNVSHGPLLMLGAYTTFWLFHWLGLNPYLSLVVSMPLLFLVGVVLQRLFVSRVVDAPELSSLLLTFGISIALVNLAQLAFTADLRSVEYLTGSFVLGPFAFSKSRVIACAFAIVITAGAFLFLKMTRLGKAIRAVSQSRDVAQVCGIDVERIHMIAFGIGSALAAAGRHPRRGHGRHPARDGAGLHLQVLSRHRAGRRGELSGRAAGRPPPGPDRAGLLAVPHHAGERGRGLCPARAGAPREADRPPEGPRVREAHVPARASASCSSCSRSTRSGEPATASASCCSSSCGSRWRSRGISFPGSPATSPSVTSPSSAWAPIPRAFSS